MTHHAPGPRPPVTIDDLYASPRTADQVLDDLRRLCRMDRQVEEIEQLRHRFPDCQILAAFRGVHLRLPVAYLHQVLAGLAVRDLAMARVLLDQHIAVDDLRPLLEAFQASHPDHLAVAPSMLRRMSEPALREAIGQVLESIAARGRR